MISIDADPITATRKLVNPPPGAAFPEQQRLDFEALRTSAKGAMSSYSINDLGQRRWSWRHSLTGIWKLTVTFGRIVHGYCFPKQLAAYFPDTGTIPEEKLPLVAFLINREGFQLKSQHVDAFIEYLLEKYAGQFDAVRETTVIKPNEKLPSKFVEQKISDYEKQNKFPPLLFIPLIFTYTLAGVECNHIVITEVNFNDKCIYYYDSQGISPSAAIQHPFSVFDICRELSEIQKMCFPTNPAAPIIENQHQHQEDFHSCGVYCCDYMERRLQGESFAQISLNGKSTSEIEHARILIGIKLGTPVEFLPEAESAAKEDIPKPIENLA